MGGGARRRSRSWLRGLDAQAHDHGLRHDHSGRTPNNVIIMLPAPESAVKITVRPLTGARVTFLHYVRAAITLLMILDLAQCASRSAPVVHTGEIRPSYTRHVGTDNAALQADGGVSVPLPPPLPVLDPLATAAEAARLRALFRHEVHSRVPQIRVQSSRWIALTRAMLAAHHIAIGRAQIVVVVDRNPRVQEITLLVVQPDAPWIVIGGTHVSTGQPNRHGYYITPTGVFVHDDSILDYRAQGTFNKNHIRGLGVKGMRVWDFGWQWADKGWLNNGERGLIRLLMHSTDPTYLAQRIGRPASEGCVRVPADMNRFMDRHGVLDADYEQAATYDIAFRAILPRDAVPTPLVGDKLVVVDSSRRPGESPVAAVPGPSSG